LAENKQNEFEENTWNQRDDRKPIFRWLILAFILAVLAYLSSGI